MNDRSYQIKNKSSKTAVNIFVFLLVLGLCFSILYPLLKLAPTVFSEIKDIGNPNVIWLPLKFSITSFRAAIRFVMPAGIWTLLKTVLYAAGIMVLQVFFSAMVGYAMARVKSVLSKVCYFLVILVFLVPRQSLLLAQYIFFKHFDFLGIMNLTTTAGEVDLINNPITLVLLAIFGFGVNQALFIFLFAQFFRNIPKELEEAANIDGCGFIRTYFRIMLPNAIPIISTVATLSFVWNYGDTYFTNYFSPDAGLMSTLLSTTFVSANKNYVLNAIQTWYEIPAINDFAFDAAKQAGVLIYLIPLLIVFLIGQRKLVQNMESSGLVG
jgi:multiple sugar transport system permease protein